MKCVFFAAALSCCVSTALSQLDPEIVGEIIPEVTRQGGQAKLNCTVVNKQDGHTVTWTFMNAKSGGEVISNDENICLENVVCSTTGEKKYKILKTEYNRRITYTLVIDCLELVDNGYYKCYIQIRGDSSASWPNKIGYLIVQALSQLDPEIVGEIIPEVTRQGGQAKLNCTVVNKQDGHTVTWTFMNAKSGGEVISNDENICLENVVCSTTGEKKYKILKTEYNRRITYTLVIDCLELVDNGYYKCYIQIRGDSSASWPNKIGYLIVQALSQLDPEIVGEIIPEVTRQGGQAKLNCTVVNKQDGHTVTWTFMNAKSGGEVISNDENICLENVVCSTTGEKKYKILKTEYNRRITYTLVIDCLELVDNGYYKCYIQIRGDSSASWPNKIGYLIVQVPPTITSKNVTVVQVDEGQMVNLTCAATGVPAPNITWMRCDGRRLPNGQGALWKSSNLVIQNFTKHDGGLYKCVADNHVRPPDNYLVSVSVTGGLYKCVADNHVRPTDNFLVSASVTGASTISISLLATISIVTLSKLLL